jgi:hypothetical protein
LKQTKHNQAEDVPQPPIGTPKQEKIESDGSKKRKNNPKNGHIIRQRRKPKQKSGTNQTTSDI